jgi:dTDP-4-dehydrorhamnose reductase
VKVLITGASGQVGSALQASVPSGIELLATSHAQLDIGDASAVGQAVADFAPAVIINAAAYVAVDKAETEPETALAINTDAPRHLARAAEKISGCRLIHISTDYVFDGRQAAPYRPGDAPHPLGVYGRSKLEGERAVLGVLADRAVILRTAWVYAPQGRNFVLSMLRLMRERPEVRVVSDQTGSPTAASSTATALWAIAQRPDVRGILHWTDAGTVTRCDFAAAIAEEALRAGLLSVPVRVTPIATTDAPGVAPRPAHSVLDIGETVAKLGIDPRPWRVALRATLAQLGSR